MAARDETPRSTEPDPPEPTPPNRRRLLSPMLPLKLGLTALVLYLVLGQIEPNRLWGLLAMADLGLLAFAAAYSVVISGLKPWRWLWLLRTTQPQARYAVALRSTLVGAGARLLLPGKVGEFARVLEVDGLKPLTGVGLTALDLLLEVAAALAFAIPAALLFLGPAAASLTLLLTIGLILGLLRPGRILGPLAALPGLQRLRPSLERAQEAALSIGRPVLLRGLFLSLVIGGIRFAQLYVILIALGAVPGAGAVLGFPLIQLADGFPLTVGGLGVREWIGLQILPGLSIRPEAAVAALLLQFALGTLLPALAGWWVILRGRALDRLREALAKAWERR